MYPIMPIFIIKTVTGGRDKTLLLYGKLESYMVHE